MNGQRVQCESINATCTNIKPMLQPVLLVLPPSVIASIQTVCLCPCPRLPEDGTPRLVHRPPPAQTYQHSHPRPHDSSDIRVHNLLPPSTARQTRQQTPRQHKVRLQNFQHNWPHDIAHDISSSCRSEKRKNSPGTLTLLSSLTFLAPCSFAAGTSLGGLVLPWSVEPDRATSVPLRREVAITRRCDSTAALLPVTTWLHVCSMLKWIKWIKWINEICISKSYSQCSRRRRNGSQQYQRFACAYTCCMLYSDLILVRDHPPAELAHPLSNPSFDF
jgi:hypothetical protein